MEGLELDCGNLKGQRLYLFLSCCVDDQHGWELAQMVETFVNLMKMSGLQIPPFSGMGNL